MSEALEPREVEKPFLGRWLMMTLGLLLGAPVTFGVSIALVATISLLAARLPTILLDTGIVLVTSVLLLLPLWTVLGLLARHAERSPGRTELLHRMARGVVGASVPACPLACVSWLVHWALAGSPAIAGVIGSLTWDTLLVVLPLGVCFCPLVALGSGLSVVDTYHLSRKASRLNGEATIVAFMAGLAALADWLAWVLPAAALITAAFLVFTGVFCYVAYRDIFERKTERAAQPVLARPGRRVPVRRPMQLP
jgi:hypothetical protein